MNDDFLSDEDKILFRKIMNDVKRLPQSNKIVEFAVEKKRPLKTQQQKKQQTKIIPTATTRYLSDYYTEEVQTDSILSYCLHSIPKKRFRELKSGLIPKQASLDLHGLKPETAREALIAFITQQTQLAHRCILIIHGKGSHQGEIPVLKNLVHHWLPQFPQVLAFHSAQQKEGGAGALYVLLKRQKEEKI